MVFSFFQREGFSLNVVFKDLRKNHVVKFTIDRIQGVLFEVRLNYEAVFDQGLKLLSERGFAQWQLRENFFA